MIGQLLREDRPFQLGLAAAVVFSLLTLSQFVSWLGKAPPLSASSSPASTEERKGPPAPPGAVPANGAQPATGKAAGKPAAPLAIKPGQSLEGVTIAPSPGSSSSFGTIK
jgi:hypothetical protein